ncbi:MAG TPA: CHRD domain-containing protein [Xanthobacteraceae bacterium]|nr:CHRD domain-containing protein [Xanthobacteraceae bacterium]
MRARVLAIALAAIAGLAIFGSTGAFAQGVPLFAVLNGGNECNGASPPLCRQGDLNAYGSATIIFPTSTQICWGIVVHGATGVNAAHIHTGVTGVNGPIRIFLSPPSAPGGGSPGAAAGCRAVAAADSAAIKANPSGFYVNVHTTAGGGFPNGAVRGQLF